jgi:hypothetical protein
MIGNYSNVGSGTIYAAGGIGDEIEKMVLKDFDKASKK